MQEIAQFNSFYVTSNLHPLRLTIGRQGNVFPQEATQSIARKHFPHVSPDARLIILSQSCDIGYYKDDEEPWVEVLLVQAVTKPDNGLIQGRNPRRYHLEIHDSESQASRWFEANIDDRFKIERGYCASFAPSTKWNLADNEIDAIIRWLVYRYFRPAFPDTFNHRIRCKKDHLKKLLKKEGTQYLNGIYLYVTDEEVPDDVPYEIELLGAVTRDDYYDPKKREAAEKHVFEIESILGECVGIKVSSECKSEEDISLDAMRRFRRFTDYDYMSFDSEADTLI